MVLPAWAQVDSQTQFKGSLGGQYNSGNTDSQLLEFDLFFNHNRKWIDEWTFKLNTDYQTSAAQEISSKLFTSLRYGYSITPAFYHFYLSDYETNHLKGIFSRNRLITGLGYWFSDQNHWQWVIEGSVGYLTERLTTLEENSFGIYFLRTIYKQSIFTSAIFSQEINYSNLKQGYQLKSVTQLENPLSKVWSLLMQIKYDYVSVPPSGFKPEDLKFLIKLQFNFINT